MSENAGNGSRTPDRHGAARVVAGTSVRGRLAAGRFLWLGTDETPAGPPPAREAA